MDQTRRALLAALATSACGKSFGALSAASSPITADTANKLVLTVNEGATERISLWQLESRYEPLVSVMAKATHRAVGRVDAYVEIQRLEERLKARPEPEWIFGKTVDRLARLVVDEKYVPVARVKTPYVAGFITSPGSNITSIKDLVGKEVLLPPADVMTSALAKATLEQAGLQMVEAKPGSTIRSPHPGVVTLRYMDSQETVARAVATGWWWQAGAVNPTLTKKFEQGGFKNEHPQGLVGKVFQRMAPQPNWSFLAHPSVPTREVEAVRTALMMLSKDPKGVALLESCKIKDEIVAAQEKEYHDLVNFLK